MAAADPQASTSTFAPFRRRAFLWLWVGVVVSSVGSWAQTVGAQWLFVDDPNAATIVTLVQTAATLPVMLLALPAGVLSDAFDRRWLLFGIQVYAFVVASTLTVLTALDRVSPALLLVFTFAVGVGVAMQVPTWQPLIAELVPAAHLPAAVRLDMVSVNVARAAGPALAGAIIAAWGVPPVFALNAASVLLLAMVLLAWRRPSTANAAPERFLPALRAGGRYVRHEPVVRRLLARLALFIAPATALWALLPLIASRQLGLQAGGYGLLFAALGVGAVIGALGLGRVKAHVSSNAVLGIAAITYAFAFALLLLARGVVTALPLLLVAGLAWTATVATINAELQLHLPGWVRARAIAVYIMTFMGTQAVASPLWGQLTQRAGLPTAIELAAALVALSALVGVAWRVPTSPAVDRRPIAYWDQAELALQPDPDLGPVQVRVEYRVAREDEAAWIEAMAGVRRSRLRSGAFRWELFRVGEEPQRFVELFAVPSWDEHERQHRMRLTADDLDIERVALALAIGAPTVEHLLPARPLDGPVPRVGPAGTGRITARDGDDPLGSRAVDGAAGPR